MKLLINKSEINWENSKSYYFFNTKDPQAENLLKLAKKAPHLKSHLYLFTSHVGKICMISKKAFLTSARAVNHHLQVTKKDIWLICLPLFHVAGLSILARQFCAGFSVIKNKDSWNPENFIKRLKEKKVSLCSLVPSQLYDLVSKNLRAPKNLRALIVGGDFLSPLLYKKARDLDWPVLISYGLTETSSQIACSPLNSLTKKIYPKLKLLRHVMAKNKPARIKSLSLLSFYFDVEKKKLISVLDKKGFFHLPDRVIFKDSNLIFKGRKEDEIKILGERLNLKKISAFLEELSQNFKKEFYLLSVPDERMGNKLVLITNSFDFSKNFSLLSALNKQRMSFEKIQAIYSVPIIKKTHLSKFRQKKARKQLAFCR